MALIQWSNDLSVQVAEMDRQHQRLVGLINELHEAMSQGKGKEVIGKTVDGLLSYTRTHFSDEEKLMEKYNYPDAGHQKDMHGKFIAKAGEFKQRLAGGTMGLSIDVSDFLSDWLTSHIRKEDKKYGPYLNGLGVK